MKKYIILVLTLVILLPVQNLKAADITTPMDSLIKSSMSTIYYYAADGNRYVFPNDKTFGSWFSDFGSVKTITDAELAQIPLKGNVTYRPGVRMVKIETSPKVYVVDEGGKLRWVETEKLAEELYGEDWNKKIDDVPDVFFVNYKEGDSVKTTENYNPTAAVEEVKTINKDRGIAESSSTIRATTSVGGSATPAVPATPKPGQGLPATPATPAIPANHATSTPQQTATSTPSGTIPATPATPAVPGYGATSTIPAIPAIPAVPATPATSTPPADTTAPIISNIQATNISETSATITWITDESASSEVYYTLSSPITATSTIKATGTNNVTSHSVSLTGLSSSKTHYYVAVSKDAAGNTATSSEQSFVTLTPPPPPLPPTPSVSISEKNCSLYFVKDGNEVLITTDNYGICPGQADFIQSGSSYGVTWRENRAGTETTQIYFKKIDLNGQSLTGDIKLTQAISGRGLPSITWTDSEYGVAWQDARDDVSNPCPDCWVYGNNYEIYFVRVDSSGNKIGNETRISYCTEHCGGSELSWNTAGYYDLSWVENVGGTLVPHSAKLDASGNITQ